MPRYTTPLSMLACFGFRRRRSAEPTLVSIVVVNQIPEVVFVKTNTFRHCPICMDDDRPSHSTKFKCACCKQCVCEGCVKSIIGVHGSSSKCPMCRSAVCRKSQAEIIRAENSELVRTVVRDPSIQKYEEHSLSRMSGGRDCAAV